MLPNDDNFNMSMNDDHDFLNYRVLRREPYSNFESSPFVSPLRGGRFDQSALNSFNRSRFRNAYLFRSFDDDFDNMSYEQLNSLFPNIPRGANEDTIQRLPTDTFENGNNQNDEKKEDDENNKCCICLERFKDGDEIR